MGRSPSCSCRAARHGLRVLLGRKSSRGQVVGAAAPAIEGRRRPSAPATGYRRGDLTSYGPVAHAGLATLLSGGHTAVSGYEEPGMTDVLIRPPRAGDGQDLAAIWLEFAEYYV